MGSEDTEGSLTRAWFADDGRDGAAELFVETPDRVGCLFAVVTAIIGARVRILKSEATIADGLARDWFLLVEADGGSLAASRREQVRSRVLAAIATWHSVPSPKLPSSSLARDTGSADRRAQSDRR
jgi:UTP:GlnB (protein PII) uridylyltransferase